MLSTLAMVRLGKKYGNIMIDMQPTNSKLAARSRRVVARVAGTDPGTAAQALDRTGGDVKAAILVARSGCSPQVARALLARAGGHLREALDALRAPREQATRPGA